MLPAAIPQALRDVGEFQEQLLKLLRSVETAAGAGRLGSRAPLLHDLELQSDTLRQLGQRVLNHSLPGVSRHQTKESEVVLARQQLDARVASIRKLGTALHACEADLREEMHVADGLLPSTTATNSEVSLAWIIQSARKLSYTTHAPPNWYCDPFRILDQDYALEPRFHYSYPTEAEMKRNFSRVMALRQKEEEAQPEEKEEEETTAAVQTDVVVAEEEEQEREAKRARLSSSPPPAPTTAAALPPVPTPTEEDEDEEEEEEDDFLDDL